MATLAAVLFVTAMLLGFSARADEYDTLRQRWKDMIVGTGYDTNDATVTSQLSSIASSANGYWSNLNKSASRTYLWSDAASTSVSAHITTAYSRLRSMALAYATPGCSLYTNATLLADIISGLDWMDANRYNATKSQYDNWWDWEIGSPLQLDDLAVLLYDQLSTIQKSNYMAAVNHNTPIPDMTGANLVWKAHVVGIRGCVVKDSAKIALARDAFSTVFPYVTNGDGFYTDGSFVQHSYHPYTAGYGAALLANMAPVISWLSGSTWAITDPAQTNIYEWVFNAYQPIIYRGAAFDLVRGREVSRSSSSPQATGHGIMDSILQLVPFAASTEAARMKSLLKDWAQSDTARDFVTTTPLPRLALAQAIMDDTNVLPRGELIGHYTFAEMDRVVHLGKGYGFGLSFCSTRIANFESINGENLHGWFTGDGLTTLYNSDLTQLTDAYWPTVDAFRLPGVTADTTASKLPAVTNASWTVGPRAQGQSTRSPYAWAGGATLGRYGAAGMQLKGWNVTLTAKKSWFMFDDEIVCVGAGITSSDGRPIETTVENRKLASGGANVFTVDGTAKPSALGWSETMNNVHWAHLAGSVPGADIGYYFPQPATLNAVREARTGAWSDVDEGSSSTPITRNYLRFGFNHGANPVNATYQYVLLPNHAPWQIAEYAAHPQIAILTNTTAAQAVRENTLGITAANFWDDSNTAADLISCNRKASVLVQTNGTFLDIAVSDPTQTNQGTINLTLAASATALIRADPGVDVIQTSPTIQLSISVNGAAGKTFTARFYLLTPGASTLNPAADTYVYDGSPTNNYGTSPTMVVKSAGAGYNRRAFLRFDLASLPPGNIGSATLALMPTSVAIPGVHAIANASDNSWSETALTWNNQPGHDAPIATWTPPTNAPVNVPVDSAVAAALQNGSNVVSFCIYADTATSNGYVEYGARENATANYRPKLQLLYTHSPPTVLLTSPAEDTLINRPGPLTLTAKAQGGDGAIATVAFYDNGLLLATNPGPTLSFTTNLAGGSHSLVATATDNNGLTSSTVPVLVYVGSPPIALGTNASTPNGVALDVDLRALVSDSETPLTGLLFTLGAASNGSVTMLADGHTARFTPNAGYRGPASFAYAVTDTTEDPATLLHYNLQGNTTDVSGNRRDAVVKLTGNGSANYLNDVPGLLTPWLAKSLQLVENDTAGAAKIEYNLSTNLYNLQTGDWTVAGWCKRVSTTDLDLVFHLGSGSGQTSRNELQVRFDSGNNTFRLQNDNASGNDVALTTTAASGVWHHFAVVRAGSTLRFYLNGNLVGTDISFAFTFDLASAVTFGGNGTTSYAPDRWLNGSLADLALFSRALSGTEITRLATSSDVGHFKGQSATNTVALTVWNNLELWRQTYFNTNASTGAAADNADPNADGEINLLEFATGQDPIAVGEQPLSVALTSTNCLVTYSRSTSALADGFQFTIESTSQLTAPSWSNAGVSESVVSSNGIRQTVRAAVPFNGAAQRFVRLKITP